MGGVGVVDDGGGLIFLGEIGGGGGGWGGLPSVGVWAGSGVGSWDVFLFILYRIDDFIDY